MVCTMNQLNLDNAGSNNLSLKPTIGHSKSSTAQLVVDQAQGGDVNIPRQLNEQEKGS